jgi:hypothetical protein
MDNDVIFTFSDLDYQTGATLLTPGEWYFNAVNYVLANAVA